VKKNVRLCTTKPRRASWRQHELAAKILEIFGAEIAKTRIRPKKLFPVLVTLASFDFSLL
jgi:hypothetical protein